MAMPKAPRVTWKSLITSGATTPSSCMSMPSQTSTSMQTKSVAHWKALSGERDSASPKVMADGWPMLTPSPKSLGAI